MPFKQDFARCLSPFPPPDQLSATFSAMLPKLKAINNAWTASGGSLGFAMSTLIVTAGITGIDLEILAAAGGITVAAYLARCASCAAAVAADEIWQAVASCQEPSDAYFRNQLVLAANHAGIPNVG